MQSVGDATYTKKCMQQNLPLFAMYQLFLLSSQNTLGLSLMECHEIETYL